MDPVVTGALVSGGFKLLGGLFGSKSKKKEAARAYAQHRARFVHTREDAEKAGFNPLTALASGSISPPVLDTGAGMMGQALAEAGVSIGNSFGDREALKIEKAKVEMERAKLAELVRSNTIQPKVGGIYAGTVRQPGVKSPGVRPSITAPALTADLTAGADRARQEALLEEGETNRSAIYEGGNVRDRNIYESRGVWSSLTGKPWFTQAPGMGQKVEDNYGDLMAAPLMIPNIVSDVTNNLWGNEYDPEKQVWKQSKKGVLRSMQSSVDKQEKWSKQRAARKAREAEWKNRPAARDLKLNPYLKGF